MSACCSSLPSRCRSQSVTCGSRHCPADWHASSATPPCSVPSGCWPGGQAREKHDERSYQKSPPVSDTNAEKKPLVIQFAALVLTENSVRTGVSSERR